MKQFERGIPRVVCGMSGDELAREIIVHAGLKPVEFREAYPFDRSRNTGQVGFWHTRSGRAA